jgi:hypothetical protein
MSDPIKNADIEFVQNQLDQIKKYASYKNLVSDFIPHVQAAMDLTNDSIPLNVTKITHNLYKFERLVPEKLFFKSYEDAKKYAESSASLTMYVEQPIPLSNSTIISIDINIVDLQDVRYVFFGKEYSDFTNSLLLFSIVGTPIFLLNYLFRQQVIKMVKDGFDVVISGTFTF